MRKIRKAYSVVQDRCDCGCGGVNVFLCDEKGTHFACFSLSEDQWMPFAQDAIRICQNQEPNGPPQPVMH